MWGTFLDDSWSLIRKLEKGFLFGLYWLCFLLDQIVLLSAGNCDVDLVFVGIMNLNAIFVKIISREILFHYNVIIYWDWSLIWRIFFLLLFENKYVAESIIMEYKWSVWYMRKLLNGLCLGKNLMSNEINVFCLLNGVSYFANNIFYGISFMTKRRTIHYCKRYLIFFWNFLVRMATTVHWFTKSSIFFIFSCNDTSFISSKQIRISF